MDKKNPIPIDDEMIHLNEKWIEWQTTFNRLFLFKPTRTKSKIEIQIHYARIMMAIVVGKKLHNKGAKIDMAQLIKAMADYSLAMYDKCSSYGFHSELTGFSSNIMREFNVAMPFLQAFNKYSELRKSLSKKRALSLMDDPLDQTFLAFIAVISLTELLNGFKPDYFRSLVSTECHLEQQLSLCCEDLPGFKKTITNRAHIQLSPWEFKDGYFKLVGFDKPTKEIKRLLQLLCDWQEKLIPIQRWTNFLAHETGTNVRVQNDLQHSYAMTLLAMFVLGKIKEGNALDEELILECVVMHDLGEAYLGRDILYSHKSSQTDAEEYVAFSKSIEKLDDISRYDLERAFLLQFCLDADYEAFPEYARDIMAELKANKSREALVFAAVEHFDYFMFELENYRKGNEYLFYHTTGKCDVWEKLIQQFPDLAKIMPPEILNWIKEFRENYQGDKTPPL